MNKTFGSELTIHQKLLFHQVLWSLTPHPIINMTLTKVYLSLIGVISLVAVAAGIEEAEITGAMGAGYRFIFDPNIMSHVGNAGDSTPYTGGDPGCCEKCRRANDPERWGTTDMFNYSWEDKYNYNSCSCFTAPTTPEGKARLRSKEDGPIIGYCGEDSTFLDQVDGTFGEDKTFTYASVEKIDSVWYVKSSELCCQKCGEEFPETQMFLFRKSETTCNCYKAKSGTNPKTFGEGSYNGVCSN